MSARGPQAPGVTDPELILERLRNFLKTAREPVLREAGEDPVPLSKAGLAVELRGGACVLHFWSDRYNRLRRVAALRQQSARTLHLRLSALSRQERAARLDDRPAGSAPFLETSAQGWVNELRRLLERRSAGWRIEGLTAAPDLARSLSPCYVRGMSQRGRSAWALLAAPPDADAARSDAALAFGLIWLDELRRTRPELAVRGLQLVLPAGRAAVTALRLPWLRRDRAAVELLVADEGDDLREAPSADRGNLTSEPPLCRPLEEPRQPAAGWLAEIIAATGADCWSRTDGRLAVSIAGLTFAYVAGPAMTYGFGRQQAVSAAEVDAVVSLGLELRSVRRAHAPDREHRLYRLRPERWLESQVRREIQLLDPNLLPSPVYSEAATTLGLDRGAADLLACDRDGRLAVIELKTAEDLAAPLQLLDYWLRVERSRERGELQSQRYFPGLRLQPAPARLALAAPALHFHPKTDVLLSFFSTGIGIELIGLNASWRDRLEVLFRKRIMPSADPSGRGPERHMSSLDDQISPRSCI